MVFGIESILFPSQCIRYEYSFVLCCGNAIGVLYTWDETKSQRENEYVLDVSLLTLDFIQLQESRIPWNIFSFTFIVTQIFFIEMS